MPDGASDAPRDSGVPVVCAPLMAPPIATPSPPSTVAVADVNGDGKPDLVFTLAGNSSADPVVGPSLNVMLGNGDGSYQSARSTVLDPDPHAFVGPPLLADLNGDGALDVVIKSADVQLVLGDGRGNFALGDHFAAPGNVFRLGDLDRDGNVDIALVGNGVTLVFGTGGGNFAAPVSLDTTSVYQALEIADINGDHIPDLVVVGSSLAVFRGRGDRTFEAPVKATPAGDDGLHGLAVGDLDADGLADIVTSGLVSSTGTVTVETWLGAADGSLTRRGQLSLLADHRTDLPPPAFVPVLAVGDFDRDTMLDVAVTYANRDVIYLIKGNGTGDLTSSTQIATDRNVGTITSADADGDGRLDLIVANTAIDVLLATPDGGFRAPFEIRRFSDFIDHHGSSVLFAAGDLDGDGKLDFVDGSLDVDLERDVQVIEVARLSGGGFGGRHFLSPFEGVIGVQAIVLRDIDGDGDLDILASRSASVTVFVNPGNGQFGSGVEYRPDPVLVGTGFAVGDVDGDHRPDFVVSGQVPGTTDFIVRVMKNDGAGNFSILSSFPGTGVGLLQDFNGDGRDDLVDSGSSSLEVRLSKGDGSFESPIPIGLGVATGRLVATDVDGDGVLDLVAGSASQTVFLHGNGNGTFANAVTLPTPPGGLLAVANIDNVPPLDLVGHNGIIYRAGNDVRTDLWSMYATDVRDVNGDGHPDVLGMGFHSLFDVPRTHAAFVLVNPCH